jgi:hypothetical protein
MIETLLPMVKLMHFEPIKWFMVIVRCIGWCFYLGFQLAEGSPCNGGPLSTFSWSDFDSKLQYMKHCMMGQVIDVLA